MNDNTREINDHFQNSGGGWEPVPAGGADAVAELTGPGLTVLANAHACCGVVVAESVEQVQQHWKEWEQRLLRVYRAWKQDHPLRAPLARDVFLVLLLDGTSAADPSALAAVANDTFGSRKILLERENRTVRGTLADLAFFSAGAVVVPPPTDPQTPESASAPDVTLNPKVLDALSYWAASTIFDKLLEDNNELSHPRA